MIADPQIKAQVTVIPSRSFAIPTTPGRKLVLRDGMANVYDERDFYHLLPREDLVIEISNRWVDFLPKWIETLDVRKSVQAKLVLPPGCELQRTSTGGYELLRHDPEVHIEDPETQTQDVVGELARRRGRPPKQNSEGWLEVAEVMP